MIFIKNIRKKRCIVINFDPNAYKDYVVTRKRYLPDETIRLTKDTVFFVSEKLIVTSWKAITKRPDFAGGMTAYFPEYGVRTGKFMDENGSTLYWYNDIGEVFMDGHSIKFNDLLLDVIVYPDGSVRHMDIDEFAEAIEKCLITREQEIKALKSYGFLIDLLHKNEFDRLQAPLVELSAYLNTQSL